MNVAFLLLAVLNCVAIAAVASDQVRNAWGVSRRRDVNDRLLSRQRRYLVFPKGANFVMTIILVKALVHRSVVATNVNVECDVPFALPYESHLRVRQKLRKQHRRRKHRRDVLDQIELAIKGIGLDGNTCVQQMICEANKYKTSSKQHFVADLIYTVFRDMSELNDGEYGPLDEHDFYYKCKPHCGLIEHCPFPVNQLLQNIFKN